MRLIQNNNRAANLRAMLASRFGQRRWGMAAGYIAIAVFVLLVLIFIARSHSSDSPTSIVAPNGKGGMMQISTSAPTVASSNTNSTNSAANTAGTSLFAQAAQAGDPDRPTGFPTDPSRNDAIVTKDYFAHGGASDTGAVDIGFTADKNAAGSPIHATHSGTVKTLRDDPTYGNLVYVIGKDYTTTYGHLQSISVTDGQSVKRGDSLGAMGNTGSSDGIRLDYQVWHCSGDPSASGTAARSCNNVNPADFLK